METKCVNNQHFGGKSMDVGKINEIPLYGVVDLSIGDFM